MRRGLVGALAAIAALGVGLPALPTAVAREVGRPGCTVQCRYLAAGDEALPLGRSDQGRSSTKPAAAKSPSKANASRRRRRRITAKLVASTNEYSRSSCWRSQASARS